MTQDVGQMVFIFLVAFVMMLILFFLRYMQYQRKETLMERGALQQDDIFNISSRVQNQENQWTSRDNAAYLSIEHITINNQMNKPPYNDAPPSYEEAMRIVAAAQRGEASSPTAVPNVVVEAPKPNS